MKRVTKKDAQALRVTIQEVDSELSLAFTDFEEWADRHKEDGAVVIRCMIHNENRVAVLERTLGSSERLKELADLVINDEHDQMYDVFRKVYDNESNVND